MDENTLQLKLTVCTLTSESLFNFISNMWSIEPKEENMLHCPNNYKISVSPQS
jgi:hypothetical protein